MQFSILPVKALAMSRKSLARPAPLTAWFVTDGARVIRKYWDREEAGNFTEGYNGALAAECVPATVERIDLIPLDPAPQQPGEESHRSEKRTPQSRPADYG
jgi:hypothetical protein